MEDKREIVRSNRPRLSQRKVTTVVKDQGNTASMTRLSEDTRPKPNIQALKKWVKVLRVILRSKLLHTLQEAMDRIHIRSAGRYAKEHLMAYRLKKLWLHVSVDQKLAAFRRTLLMASLREKKSSQPTIKARETLLSKAATALFSLLDSKMKGLQRGLLQRLAVNRKLVKKVEQFSRLTKINVLSNLQKSRELAALLRIQGAAANKKNRAVAVKVFHNLQAKCSSNKHYAIVRIHKRAVEVKQAAAAQPAAEVAKPVEEVFEEPPSVEKPVDRKLQMTFNKLQTETSSLKQKLERELEQKQRKQRDLQAKLEQLSNQNKQLQQVSRVSSSRVSPVKDQQPESPPKTRVYENIFTNLLFFLRNSEENLTKEKLLENLLVPMSRIDMPIETIRMENEVLEEVLEQYRKLKLKLPPKQQRPSWSESKPYEYLLKENRQLYETLKELSLSVDPTRNSRGLEQLARDFETLQKQLASRSPSKA